MEDNKLLVPAAIVIAGVFIAGAIYFDANTTPTNKPLNAKPATEVPAPTLNDHFLGERDAPIVIVEYSDTECPFCKTYHDTLKEVVRSYEGKVSWVYRHFPIRKLHERASKEAEATECAAELAGNQGFWKYIDRLFEITESNDSLDPQELPEIAKFIGLDETEFEECLSSGRYTEKVTKSVEEAVRVGARGTPYSVIIGPDGEQVVVDGGAEPVSRVKARIDTLLD